MNPCPCWSSDKTPFAKASAACTNGASTGTWASGAPYHRFRFVRTQLIPRQGEFCSRVRAVAYPYHWSLVSIHTMTLANGPLSYTRTPDPQLRRVSSFSSQRTKPLWFTSYRSVELGHLSRRCNYDPQ